ncbi:MAG: tetratricopeptide repeat protein, partial [Anaerolineales bacterium]|nr:tetratricopeptide repeat protein [Anaerolineales bacterium]
MRTGSDPNVNPPKFPKGTVTFLLSDIEGSTKLLNHLSDKYGELLLKHASIFRSAIQRWRGYEVDNQGDSFFVAFESAQNALAAAEEIQHQLTAQTWPKSVEVRVRMGIHTGEPTIIEDRYIGMDVHRAARICQIGHGGQVLISGTTAAIVQNDDARRVELQDLGEHRLKDLESPEHIYQLNIPGMPFDYPPLRSLDARPNNLPVLSTPLLGREEDLAAAKKLITQPEVRLLTLTGPGGIGKTRLALELALELSRDFQDGVFLIPLVSVTDPSDVPAAIARTLGVRDFGTRPLLDLLIERLRTQHLLLLLDNFEHVIPAVGLITALLENCKELKILVTSREVLRVSSEYNFAVGPLALPDPLNTQDIGSIEQNPAIQLFLHRAASYSRGFKLTEQNVPVIAQICSRVDGLPLAIELAAARIKSLAPQELLKRLQPGETHIPLEYLSKGTRDAPERHRALRMTISWSYDLLRPDEQKFFRSLSVFIGGFNLHSATSVCGRSGDLITAPPDSQEAKYIDLIESLVDKSLINSVESILGESRFEMLETIREYAWEALSEEGSITQVRTQHAQHFHDQVKEASLHFESTDEAYWFKRLESDYPNVRAALQWYYESGNWNHGLELGNLLRLFWLFRGYLTEGTEWLERFLTLPGTENNPALRAAALDSVGFISRYREDYSAAFDAAQTSLVLRREIGDRNGEADSLANLGYIHLQTGDFKTAAEFYRDALEIYREQGNKQGIADSLSHWGLVV